MSLLVLNAINWLKPLVVLEFNRHTYLIFARDCHEARSFGEEASALGAESEPELSMALRRSTVVALMDCYQYEVMRARLAAEGIEQPRLEALYREAWIGSKGNLHYLSTLRDQ